MLGRRKEVGEITDPGWHQQLDVTRVSEMGCGAGAAVDGRGVSEQCMQRPAKSESGVSGESHELVEHGCAERVGVGSTKLAEQPIMRGGPEVQHRGANSDTNPRGLVVGGAKYSERQIL